MQSQMKSLVTAFTSISEQKEADNTAKTLINSGLFAKEKKNNEKQLN